MNRYIKSHQTNNAIPKICICGHSKGDHASRESYCEWHDCNCIKFDLGKWDESQGIKDLQKPLKNIP